MNIVDLSKILEEKYVNLKEVENISLLEEMQDSYLLGKDESIIGLHLKNVDISDISESIFGIESLLFLKLENVNFKEIEHIKFLCNDLQSLDLSYNVLKELPKEIIELKNLQSLNLYGNELKELPKEIIELKNLQSLDLSRNELKELPKEIIELKNLQSLDLSENGLKELPKEIIELKNLQSLNLYGNELKELPKEIIELKNLQSLNLSENGLKELPKEIIELKNLQSLNLYGNELKELPKEIIELKNLQSLNLSENGLKELPKEVFKLSRLSTFLLNSFSQNTNIIKTIPYEFINLSVLNRFELDENHLDSFYMTAYKGGLENLKNSIKQKIEQGVEKLYEAKLLFVGEPGAGKTSLMQKILDKDYILTTKDNTEPTIGIDIKEHTFKYTQDESINFRANMWDFGGQQVQYMSHQFFLTPNSLYVLVGDDRDQRTDFDYWFHIINLLSDDSPILVVLNEVGHESITNFDLKAFQEKFETHLIEQESIDLSKMRDGRYEVVKGKIENMLCNLSHIGEELPARWVEIRKDLNDLSKSNYFITYEKFEEITTKYKLTAEDTKTLSKHFHYVGIFLHYSEDIHGLANTIFLNSEWVMDAVYSVLSNQEVKMNNGKFTKEWLFEFWQNHKNSYSDDIKNKLLTLMLKDKFAICYKLDSIEAYISPQLLPSKLDYNYDWDYKNNLFYRFRYQFMPRGIVSMLIVRLHKIIYEDNGIDIVWKKGTVFEDGGVRAKVEEKVTEDGLKVIDISIIGDRIGSQNLLFKIKNEIESIQDKLFQNINYDEMIPCCCSECVGSEKPEYFKFSKLKNFVTKNKFSVECDSSTERVLIDKLLGNVVSKNEDGKGAELFKMIKEAGGLHIYNSSNSSTNITDSFKQNQHIEITISQSINEVTGALASLKRKVDNADDKEEISDIIDGFRELGDKPTKEKIVDSGLMSDIKGLLEGFDKKMQDTGEVISKTSKAIKSAKSLGRTYNELASLCGLPNIPTFLVKDS